VGALEVLALPLPIEARVYLQATRYRPTGSVAITLNATEHDVVIADDGFTYRTSGMTSIVPMVTLNLIVTYAIEFRPGETDFSKGFRIILGAPAPAGLTASYSFAVGAD